MKIKIIAMYFPQFYEVPENNEWWGKGFTDWNLVKNAKPQYEGHHQPRTPLDNFYYDQSKIETIEWQTNLAKKYGIYGFCHYHYWFNGRQILEQPSNILINNKHIDFPFCLSWANETWSRRWDGRDDDVLIEQTHPADPVAWKKHFDYLIQFWKDPRAIKVDGKPVFVIYRPQYITRIKEMIQYWRELAIENGLPGLYLIHQQSFEISNKNILKSFDAVFLFQPATAVNHNNIKSPNLFLLKFFRLLPERLQDKFRMINAKFRNRSRIYDYNDACNSIQSMSIESNLTTYPGCFVDWDNTARYKNRATIYKNATPQRFEYWLTQLINSMNARKLPENFIFLNAWNEWSEGAYLEPDCRDGFAKLEAIKRMLSKC